MSFRVGAALFGLALFAAPAAADPPVKWTGFYFGAHGGWANAPIDYPGAPDYPLGPPRHTIEGGVIGAQIGYNWQLRNLVFGIEADVSWGNLDGTAHDGNYLTEFQSVDWMGTVRGRVGLAFDRFLPYLTAGIMWDRASSGAACPAGALFGICAITGPFNVSDTQAHLGFVWGGGVEYALDSRWSIRLEGLHANMGDETYTVGLLSGKVEHEFTTVRVGVSYKLGAN